MRRAPQLGSLGTRGTALVVRAGGMAGGMTDEKGREKRRKQAAGQEAGRIVRQLLGQGGAERDVVDFQEEEDGDRVETNVEGVTCAKRASGRSASREEKGDLKRRSAHRR